MVFSSLTVHADPGEGSGAVSADGTSIDSLNVKWLTPDTQDDGDPAHLCLCPADNAAQILQAQVDFSMSGEHDYEAGTVKVKIPAWLIRDREGNELGNISMTYAEAPSTASDFNWVREGDDIILTNTKTLSAALQVSFEVRYEGIVPSEIMDDAPGRDFTAELTVTTAQGGELTKESDPLSDVIDTHVNMTSAIKTAGNAIVHTKEYIESRGYVIPEEYAQETEFLEAQWTIYAYVEGNTKYTLTFTDTPSDTMQAGSETVECKWFTKDEYLSGTLVDGAWKESGQQSVPVFVVYPYSQFDKDKTYTLHNSASCTCVELDTGEGKTLPANASLTYSEHVDGPLNPRGHFYNEKWGDDGDEKGTAHTNYGSTQVTGGYSSGGKVLGSKGYWGLYADGLNRLEYGQDVQVSYHQYLRGFFLPWTRKEGTDGTKVEDFGGSAITLSVEDGEITFRDRTDGSPVTLTPGTDFTFDSLKLYKPVVWKAVDPSEYSQPKYTLYYDNGQMVWPAYPEQHDGTYGAAYLRDEENGHIPDFTVEALVDGQWQTVQVVHWPAIEEESFSVDLPEGTQRYRVSVTAGDDPDGDGVYVAAIADALISPSVTLHPTERVLAIATQAILEDSVDAFLTNKNLFTASRGDETLLMLEEQGDDLLGHVDTQVMAVPDKSVKILKRDNRSQTVTLQYSAAVRMQYAIQSVDAWKSAAEQGVIPLETSCTWYDLLPRGVDPDEKTIQVREQNMFTQEGGDTVREVYEIPNYHGSGRTMLVVKVDLTPYPQKGTNGVYDLPSITFRATCSYDRLRYYSSNLHNVIAYESGNETLGNVADYMGEPDTPYSSNNAATQTVKTFQDINGADAERRFMTDLDPATDKSAFVYAGAECNITTLAATLAELSKTAMVNHDNIWSTGVSGEKQLDVYVGGTYTYRLAMSAAGDTRIAAPVLYDVLDGYVPGEDKADDYGRPSWKGSFLGVDLTSLTMKGIAPVVYYSTRTDLRIDDSEDPSQRSAMADLGNESVWSTQAPADLSTVTAVAVSCAKNSDGSDFYLEPGESIAAYIEMKAPEGEEAAKIIALNETNKAYAYNSVYLWGTMVSVSTGMVEESKLIRKDYTRVGMKPFWRSVKKVWMDNQDRDGLRPDTLTMTLLQDGAVTDKAVVLNGIPDKEEDTEEAEAAVKSGCYEDAAWHGIFENLTYCKPDGTPYYYSFHEDVPEGYQLLAVINRGNETIFRNRHFATVLHIYGEKEWEGGDAENRPESIQLILYRDGVKCDAQTVTPDENGKWECEFRNYGVDALYRYHDHGIEYQYTVKEINQGKDYVSTVTYQLNQDGSRQNLVFRVKNTYAYGYLDITKTVEDATEACAGRKFRFTLSLLNQDGTMFTGTAPYQILDAENSVMEEGTIGSGGSFELESGQRMHVGQFPAGTLYKVTEDKAEGYKADAYMISGTIGASTTETAEFVNTYSAQGRARIEGVKTLENGDLKEKQFTFVLTDGEDSVYAQNSTDGTFAFEMNYSLEDLQDEDGNIRKEKTFVYKLSELYGGESRSGIRYDGTVYTVEVQVKDRGDGTLAADAVVKDEDGNACDVKFVNRRTRIPDTSSRSHVGRDLSICLAALWLAALLYRKRKELAGRSCAFPGRADARGRPGFRQ